MATQTSLVVELTLAHGCQQGHLGPDMSVAHIIYRNCHIPVVLCPLQLVFVSPLTENVPVEGSVTSCT